MLGQPKALENHKETFRRAEYQLLNLIVGVYTAILGLFLFFLSPPIRRRLNESSERHERYLHFIADRYEGCLHALVVLRLVFLSLAPFMFSLFVFRFNATINQLLTLVFMGVSIVAFWVVELPLLTKASIEVTFATALSNDINLNNQIYKRKFWSSEAAFEPEKEHFLVVRVYNLGFHTYENATVTIYLGTEFNIIPNDEKHDSTYAKIDFLKPFKIQKSYNGVRFTPSDDNFQSIPPKGCLLFPILLISPKHAPNKDENAKIETQFTSDNSWGMTQILKPYKIVADLTRAKDSHQNH